MTNNPSLTPRKLYARHKKEHPDSMISEHAIRTAIRSGDLPAVFVGDRALVSYQMFEAWRKGLLRKAMTEEGLKLYEYLSGETGATE